jgi:phage shock protein C
MDRYMHSPNPRRFYRSRDRMIAGVAGGIADQFGWDPTLTRIVVGVMFLTGFFTGLILAAYLVIWWVTPVRPYQPRDLGPDEERFWRNVSDRPAETFSSLKYRFRSLDDRLANIERTVTSEEWRLRRQFKDLEGS